MQETNSRKLLRHRAQHYQHTAKLQNDCKSYRVKKKATPRHTSPIIKHSRTTRTTTVTLDSFRSVLFFPSLSLSLSFTLFFLFYSDLKYQRNSLWPQHGRWQQLSRDTNYKLQRRGRTCTSVFSFFSRSSTQLRWWNWRWWPRKNSFFSRTPVYRILVNGPCKVYERSGIRGDATKNFFEDVPPLRPLPLEAIEWRRRSSKNLPSFSSCVNSWPA